MAGRSTGGGAGSWGGGAWALPLSAARGPGAVVLVLAAAMLGLRAGDAVLAVDCDQRFTLATSGGQAALERRRGRCEPVEAEAAAWSGGVRVWGCSGALLLLASLLETAAAGFSVATDDELMEPERLWRRRCEVAAGLVSVGSAAASRAVMLSEAARVSQAKPWLMRNGCKHDGRGAEMRWAAATWHRAAVFDKAAVVLLRLHFSSRRLGQRRRGAVDMWRPPRQCQKFPARGYPQPQTRSRSSLNARQSYPHPGRRGPACRAWLPVTTLPSIFLLVMPCWWPCCTEPAACLFFRDLRGETLPRHANAVDLHAETQGPRHIPIWLPNNPKQPHASSSVPDIGSPDTDMASTPMSSNLYCLEHARKP